MSKRSEFVPFTAEKTFSNYTKDQGAVYAEHRPDYHPLLYKTIIDHHKSTGGQQDTILDVGCGPGLAARALAPHFASAIGIDPSEAMINNARLIGGFSSASEPIRFEVSSAEELGWHLSPPIGDSSVDLITASTAAHWFDMARFWLQAAKLLKPGGTVALWTTGPIHMHPSMPNAAAIQAAIDGIEERHLVPFFEEGNWLTRSLYAELPLPWTLPSPVVEFDEATFSRREWGPENSDEFFPSSSLAVSLDVMEKVLSTASPVQRWRKAHPEDLETDRDVVKMMRGEAERLLHEAGVAKGHEIVTGKPTGVLLMVKKK